MNALTFFGVFGKGRTVGAVEVFQRLVPLFGLDLVLKLARGGEEGLACVLAGVEGSLALVAVAELVEGLETLGDPLARFNDPGPFPGSSPPQFLTISMLR
jgi:hypothetical protein